MLWLDLIIPCLKQLGLKADFFQKIVDEVGLETMGNVVELLAQKIKVFVIALLEKRRARPSQLFESSANFSPLVQDVLPSSVQRSSNTMIELGSSDISTLSSPYHSLLFTLHRTEVLVYRYDRADGLSEHCDSYESLHCHRTSGIYLLVCL